MDIASKVALITGAGSGIGRASAVRLAAEGASVVVADVDDAGARETVAQIEAAGPSASPSPSSRQGSGQPARAAFVHADVANIDDVRSMIAFAESTFGGLDILHNNAGIITGPPRWPDTEPEAWIRMLDINLRGVILGTQLALPALRKRGGGAVVNTASMAGVGYGFPPNPVYAASKGGVVLFTASLAPLAAEANIRVNCICPGIVDTPMLRRASQADGGGPQVTADLVSRIPVIQPEEIADCVVYFIRDDSLAGRALLVRNGVPRELLRMPEIPQAFRS
jgi:NAD(P)-dependent dehydrogenase (short-subunit alcohol dehydrogenase family)